MPIWEIGQRVRVRDWNKTGTITYVGGHACQVELDEPGYHTRRVWIRFKDLEEI